MNKTLSGKMPRHAFSKRIIVWFAVVGFIVIATTALIFASITQLISSSGWVQHSYQIIDNLDVTAALFNDAQSAERGYAATCSPKMLAPFRSDLPRIYSRLASLHALTSDNPEQQQRLEHLRKSLSAELGRMSLVMTTAAEGEQARAQTMLAQQDELSALRDIHATIDTMRKVERTLLATRLDAVQFFGKLTLGTSALGVIISGLILGFVFWLIRRETTRREKSEASLHESNSHLKSSLVKLRHYTDFAKSLELLGELLQTCRNTGEAIAIVGKHLTQLLPNAVGAIALFTETDDRLENALSFGDVTAFENEFAPDDCWALRRGRIHRSQPSGTEPVCSHFTKLPPNLKCVPISAQGETLGVLSIGTERADGFGEIERQTILAITEQLSLALANLRLQETLRNQSLRDALTGVFNRRYLDDILPREVARARRGGKPLAMAMLDIDHFKKFNDTYGHEGGDRLLSAFGKLLTDHCRSEDIVCRYGGEEFALILPGANMDAARERAEALCAAVRKMKVDLRGQPLGRVTVSIGLASFPHHGSSGPGVLNAADAALYEAKKSGRDRVVTASDEQDTEPGTTVPMAG